MSIRVNDLCFSYGEKRVLRSVSFGAEYGEFLSVLGPNGAGKSTLFRCMLGILSPSAGATLVAGEDISGMTAARLARAIETAEHCPLPEPATSPLPAGGSWSRRRRRWSIWTSCTWRTGATATSAAASGSWCSSPGPSPSRPASW